MESVGRFQLVRELGRGSFGVVFEGFDPMSQARVAVKVLDGLGAGSTGRAQLLAEAAALESVTSPHTLRVLDVVDSAGVLALVTELVPGVTLRQILELHGRLSGPDALTVLHGAATGLAAVHAAGLVHGDVKPANTLVEASGASKLIDFGLAALPGWISEDSASPWGSPAYAAPEQVLHNYRDVRSDIYSLTVSLYEVLCGRRPFAADTAEGVRSQHVHEPLPDPRHFVPDLGHGLTQLLLWGLMKDPGARPPDVATWLAYLEAGASEQYGPQWAAGGAIAAIAGGLAGGGLLASGVLAGGSGAAGVAVAGGASAGAAGVAGAGAAGGASAGSSGIASGLLATAAGKGVAAAVAVAVVAGGGVGAKAIVDHSHHEPAPVAVKRVDKIAYVTCSGVSATTSCALHTMNPDGTGKSTLVTRAGDIGDLHVSLDGSQIAYSLGDGTDRPNEQVRVVKTDGSDDHQVGEGIRPVWSPNSRRLAYARYDERGAHYMLRIADVTGGDRGRTITIDAKVGGTASWSPDGSRIAYIAEQDGYGGCGGVITEAAFVANTNGSGGRTALGSLGIFDPPQWLDSDHLIVTKESHRHRLARCGGAPEAAVAVVSAAGVEERQISDLGEAASVSPNDRRVAFWRYVARKFEFLVAPTVGGPAVQVIAPKSVVEARPDISWSTDSTALVYSDSYPGGDGAIHVVGADGRNDHVIAHGFAAVWASIPQALATKAPAAAPPVDIRSFDFENALMPIGTCSPPGTWWKSVGPVQLHDGEGENFVPHDDGYEGTNIMGVSTVGYADMDHDGTDDAVLEVTCSGSPKAYCCAGRTSIEDFIVPLRVRDDDQLEIIGSAIGPANHGGEATEIRGARIRGATIITEEYYVYDLGADERPLNLHKEFDVTHRLERRAWRRG